MTADVRGTYDDEYRPVLDSFTANVKRGRELGAAIYASLDGRPVIDLQGGWVDEERSGIWGPETTVNVFSVTKLLTTVAILMLVERQAVELDARVADYWPEFAQNGKEDIRIRQVMGHTSGVAAWQQPISLEECLSQESSAARLASQAPLWAAGRAAGYHGGTFGPILSEIVLRVTGSSLGRFIRQELSEPMGAAYHLGLESDEISRVATVYPNKTPVFDAQDCSGDPELDLVTAKLRAGSLGKIVTDGFSTYNSAAWRHAELAGSNGHGSATGIGRILDVIANGGRSSVGRLMSSEVANEVLGVQHEGTDLFFRVPIRWGLGFALSSSAAANADGPMPFVKTGSGVCFWFGAGGSFAVLDLDRRSTFVYITNRGRPMRESLGAAYYRSLTAHGW